MRSKKLFRLHVVLAIVAAASLLTSAEAQKETIWHNFPVANGVDGYDPVGGVTIDANGSLWGTTALGGAYGGGVVYKLYSPDGRWSNEEVVHSFNPYNGDGYTPYSGVIVGLKDGFYRGNIYGTTYQGGTHAAGSVYELSQLAGRGYAETILHSFNGNGTDGTFPIASLIFDSAENLYGTTYSGAARTRELYLSWWQKPAGVGAKRFCIASAITARMEPVRTGLSFSIRWGICMGRPPAEVVRAAGSYLS
jgi:uncharacterized repeat protein (TIGR03803 family)